VQYFELFGLVPQYQIEASVLDAKYREAQAATHPDKYSAASEADRRAAQQHSTLVNDAYQTLKDPVLRAAYLLKSTYGADPFEETNTKMPPSFLVEQMERRETLAALRARADADGLESLHAAVRAEAQSIEAHVEQLIDTQKAFEQALTETRKLRFQYKLLADIDDALTAIA
jgi:molecular chaperone HscB